MMRRFKSLLGIMLLLSIVACGKEEVKETAKPVEEVKEEVVQTKKPKMVSKYTKINKLSKGVKKRAVAIEEAIRVLLQKTPKDTILESEIGLILEENDMIDLAVEYYFNRKLRTLEGDLDARTAVNVTLESFGLFDPQEEKEFIERYGLRVAMEYGQYASELIDKADHYGILDPRVLSAIERFTNSVRPKGPSKNLQEVINSNDFQYYIYTYGKMLDEDEKIELGLRDYLLPSVLALRLKERNLKMDAKDLQVQKEIAFAYNDVYGPEKALQNMSVLDVADLLIATEEMMKNNK